MNIDLTNLDLFESGEVETIFAELRQEAPVYWNPSATGEGFWVLTRYKEVASAWKQSAIFSSEHGNMLRLREYKDPAAGKMMVVTDPPRHTKLRTLLNHGFTPQSVALMEPQIHSFVCELLDQLVPNQSFDFVADVASKLPVCVTCHLMGIPRTDWKFIASLSTSSFAAEDHEFWKGASLEQTLAIANTEILYYFIDLIARRRRHPEQDLVSILAGLKVNGNKLNNEEIALNCFSFLLGGNETTQYVLAAGLQALTQWTDEVSRLREDFSLMPTAVEEILRWSSPNFHVLRIATRDVSICGKNIRSGDRVTLWSASANRDDKVFSNPYKFDIGRLPNQHVTFGIGNHYCIGANIARLELKAFLLEMLKRDYRFEVVGEPVRLRSNFLSGFKHLYVRLLS